MDHIGSGFVSVMRDPFPEENEIFTIFRLKIILFVQLCGYSYKNLLHLFSSSSNSILTFNGRIRIWTVMKLDSGIHHEGNIRGGLITDHVVSTYST
jgi:hypothetical protein